MMEIFMQIMLKKRSFFSNSLKINKKEKNKKNLKVLNTYLFLKKLGELKRNKTKAKIISITGSSGKTTVKDLVGNLINFMETPISLQNLITILTVFL